MWKIGPIIYGYVKILHKVDPESFLQNSATVGEKIKPGKGEKAAYLSLVYEYPYTTQDNTIYHVATVIFCGDEWNPIQIVTIAASFRKNETQIVQEGNRNIQLLIIRGLLSIQETYEEVKLIQIPLFRRTKYKLRKLQLEDPVSNEPEKLFTVALINQEILRMFIKTFQEQQPPGTGYSDNDIINFNNYFLIPEKGITAYFNRVGPEVGIVTRETLLTELLFYPIQE